MLFKTWNLACSTPLYCACLPPCQCIQHSYHINSKACQHPDSKIAHCRQSTQGWDCVALQMPELQVRAMVSYLGPSSHEEGLQCSWRASCSK